METCPKTALPFRYPVLDSVRGIAVLWVLWHHTVQFFQIDQDVTGFFLRKLMHLAWLGYLGVDLFFVLSGFLISGLLLPELDTGIRITRFYIRRIFKIVPTYLAVVAVCLIIAVALPRANPPFAESTDGIHPASFFFLQNYLPITSNLSHTWSLAIEEHFYVLYPLFLVLIFKVVHNPANRRLAAIAGLLMLLVLFNVLRQQFLMASIRSAGASVPSTQWRTHFRVDALIFGCLCKACEPYIIDAMRYRGFRSLLSTAGICTCLVIGCWFWAKGFQGDRWYCWTLAYIAAGAFIISACFGWGILGRLLLIPPGLALCGRCSYAIYLVHIPLAWVFVYNHITGWDIAIVFVFLSLLLGKACTETLERYFLNLRSRISN